MIILTAAILLVGPVQAGAEHHVIDPQHLTVGFLVEHVGFAKIFGRFREAEGSFDFDETTGEIRNIRVVVKTTSVDTTVERRDRHLRSADFLNVEEYPEMVFESQGAKLVDRKATIEGNLSLIGSTRPIQLDVTWNKSGTSPQRGNPYVTGLSVRGSFRRSEFGMTYGVADAVVGDDVELIIELEARRQ